jgi:two-component system LytT family sensor kinase
MIKYILKIVGVGTLIGLLLFGLDVAFRFLSDYALPTRETWLWEATLYILYSTPLALVNALFFYVLEKRFSSNKKSNIRLLVGFVGSMLLTLLTMFCIRIVHKILFLGFTVENFINTESPRFYFITILITLVISLFFHAFYFYKKIQENKVKKQQIIAGNASAQFESLKNQIDPHFLFNSLNVLSSLIDEQPETAQKFTNSLSKIYRYVLEQKNKELVLVEEELDFAREYMDLLKIRFENSITYTLPQQLQLVDSKVVPLSLQLLLENTIKHNIVSENNPLHIHIYEEDNYLVVKNNLQKKEAFTSRKGVGLQNIADRYKLATDRQVLIVQDETSFQVKIPLLTKKITTMENLSTDTNSTQEAYSRAQQRVNDIKDFYGHLLSYIIVMAFLIFINYFTFWGYKWFLFPLLGWGIGISIHAFTVFGYGSRWEQRKIQEIMEKEQQRKMKKWK